MNLRRIVSAVALSFAFGACTTGHFPASFGGASNLTLPAGSGTIASLQAAASGEPDAATQTAMQVLLGVLNAEDWGYLIYASWPDDGGAAASTDPTLQKAAVALASAAGSTLTTQSSGLRLQSRHAVAGGGGVLGGALSSMVSIPQWQADYPMAQRLLQNNGVSYAANSAVATAFAYLLASAAIANGSILPKPTVDADGNLAGCGKSFYNGQSTTASCAGTDFCCKGEIDFPSGKDVCLDFTSCRGLGDPTMWTAAGVDAGTDGGSDADDSSSDTNVCDSTFTDGTALPPEWNEACAHLNPATPTFVNCLQANPAFGIGPAVLPNGQSPSAVCVSFSDADGAGTSLGVTDTCDPSDPGYSPCWCCPSD